MFSGIIEELGTIREADVTGLTIEAQQVLTDLAIKDSIAIDGVCLTVIARGDNWFRVETIPETMRCTNLGRLPQGTAVNLERALAANGRIGGHIVQGHIESCVTVLGMQEDGIGLSVEMDLPAHLRPFLVTKGFVALNGVSLTIVAAQDERFSIALIPYTRAHTNLGQLQPGTEVNLESDILGRSIAHYLQIARTL